MGAGVACRDLQAHWAGQRPHLDAALCRVHSARRQAQEGGGGHTDGCLVVPDHDTVHAVEDGVEGPHGEIVGGEGELSSHDDVGS